MAAGSSGRLIPLNVKIIRLEQPTGLLVVVAFRELDDDTA